MNIATDEPIGKALKSNREAQNLTPDDIVSILKIRLQLVHTIEEDNYPSQNIDVFMKGHIISYSKYLNINPQIILNKLEAKGYNLPAVEQHEPKKKTKRQYPLRSLTVILILFITWNLLPKNQHKPVNITQPIRYGDFQ